MQTTINGGSWNTGLTRGTSIESYKLLDGMENSQMAMMLKTYLINDGGLTDEEMQIELYNKYNVRLDKARIAGRRFDINKKYGKSIIVNNNQRTKTNKTGKKALVWSVNKIGLEEY